jgi:hypothetical protein
LGRATNVAFDDVEVTVSDQFNELHPDRKLPPFAWLKPEGKAGQDDHGTVADDSRRFAAIAGYAQSPWHLRRAGEWRHCELAATTK